MFLTGKNKLLSRKQGKKTPAGNKLSALMGTDGKSVILSPHIPPLYPTHGDSPCPLHLSPSSPHPNIIGYTISSPSPIRERRWEIGGEASILPPFHPPKKIKYLPSSDNSRLMNIHSSLVMAVYIISRDGVGDGSGLIIKSSFN